LIIGWRTDRFSSISSSTFARITVLVLKAARSDG